MTGIHANRAAATSATVLVVISALSTVTRADTFEARAQRAAKIALDDLVWAVTAACDKGDDTQQRQCRQIRDRKAKLLAGATLLVEGDATAFELGAWDAAKKSVSLKLIACVECDGVEIDGKRWHVVGTGVARFDGGKLRGAVLHDTAKVFNDSAAAATWTKPIKTVRVEHVVKLPAKPRIVVGGKDTVQVEITAWRVISVCDGAIVISSQPSNAVAPMKCK